MGDSFVNSPSWGKADISGAQRSEFSSITDQSLSEPVLWFSYSLPRTEHETLGTGTKRCGNNRTWGCWDWPGCLGSSWGFQSLIHSSWMEWNRKLYILATSFQKFSLFETNHPQEILSEFLSVVLRTYNVFGKFKIHSIFKTEYLRLYKKV